MPVNRNALIRYRTIDKCLQNRYRKWTIDDLVEACSDALYEYEGLDSGVSLRTVQGDLQVMRSDKLGYNAPIVVKDKKYYSYDDEHYSITNIPLTDQDLGKLTEAVEFMKQFQGFSHFQELDGMVQKLEDHIYSQKTKQQPVVEMEKNDNLKGLAYLDMLYKAIVNKRTLSITYQSFKARQSQTFLFYAYLLKEYRNRWFLVGRQSKKPNILFLALDRMEKLAYSEEPYWEAEDFNPKTFFKHAIGVSISPQMQVEEVVLWVSQQHAPYVLTKPLHHSQQAVSRDNYGTTISLKVQHNFELEKEILAFGEAMKVLAPERLKRQIQRRLRESIDLYDTALSGSNLVALKRQLQHKGYGLLNQVYTRKDLSDIGLYLDRSAIDRGNGSMVKDVLEKVDGLEKALYTPNLQEILQTMGKGPTCLASFAFFNTQKVESWHQNHAIFSGLQENHLKEAIVLRIFLGAAQQTPVFQALPGSHKKRHTTTEIELITENALESTVAMSKGGLLVYKPLLLRKSIAVKSRKKHVALELWFG